MRKDKDPPVVQPKKCRGCILGKWRETIQYCCFADCIKDRSIEGSLSKFKMTRAFIIFKERFTVGALAIFEDQKKEMHKALKMLFKTGELVLEDEDFETTEYLLQLHPTMMSVIKNYEWSQANKENGMSQFELMNAEGNARHGEHGRELNADVTANSALLKDKAAAIYQLYKTISNTICIVIDNLKDPHEELLFRMLFIDGRKSGIYAISVISSAS